MALRALQVNLPNALPPISEILSANFIWCKFPEFKVGQIGKWWQFPCLLARSQRANIFHVEKGCNCMAQGSYLCRASWAQHDSGGSGADQGPELLCIRWLLPLGETFPGLPGPPISKSHRKPEFLCENTQLLNVLNKLTFFKILHRTNKPCLQPNQPTFLICHLYSHLSTPLSAEKQLQHKQIRVNKI